VGGDDRTGPIFSDWTIEIQFSADVDFLAHQTFNKLLSLIRVSSSKKTVDE